LLLTACALLLMGTAFAQLPGVKKPKPPRALALVEWPAKGAPRVVPICILVDGRFYDASVYLADPVPLALDTGNVYEVEESGKAMGFVTVTQPKLPQGGNWFADGAFRPRSAVAAAPRPPEPAVRRDEEEGPPRLRKGKPSDTASEEPKPAAQKTSAPENKPEDKPAPGDEGRPVLRRPAEQAQTPPAAEKVPTPESVPPEPEGRPILRRGSSGPEQALALPGSVNVPSGAHLSTSSTELRSVAVTSAPAVRVLPAISDAGGPEPKPYVFQWTQDEQAKLTGGMKSLAEPALQKYAAGNGGHAGPLENVEVRAFDLTYGNEPVLILTASARPAPPPAAPRRRNARVAETPPPPDPNLTYWITLLAREDLNGDLRVLKTWATDSKHLDAYARHELIDAVDADGDGNGDLLFRLIWDHGRDFAVYRVRYDQVTQLYNSGRQ
jgi:hypothetical protein